VLLAFDGSPKAQEALFMTAYLSVFWEFIVTIVTVEEPGIAPETLDRAVAYLKKYAVDTRPIRAAGRPADAILEAAGQVEANLIVTGGYHSRLLRGSAIGHTVDTLLKKAAVPLLICR
jgi:nucleotide-binding universal stress UspA family protein